MFGPPPPPPPPSSLPPSTGHSTLGDVQVADLPEGNQMGTLKKKKSTKNTGEQKKIAGGDITYSLHTKKRLQ